MLDTCARSKARIIQCQISVFSKLNNVVQTLVVFLWVNCSKYLQYTDRGV